MTTASCNGLKNAGKIFNHLFDGYGVIGSADHFSNSKFGANLDSCVKSTELNDAIIELCGSLLE